jgi:hypothetical protein
MPLVVCKDKYKGNKRKAHEETAIWDGKEQKKRRVVVLVDKKAIYLLSKIACGGPAAIDSFLLKEMKALIVHSDPRSNNPKGNKQS